MKSTTVGLDCKTCGHPQAEHSMARGSCVHVLSGAALIGASDIICTCSRFVGPPAWVIDVLPHKGGEWYQLDEGPWESMEAAEAFALAEIGVPWGVRREEG